MAEQEQQQLQPVVVNNNQAPWWVWPAVACFAILVTGAVVLVVYLGGKPYPQDAGARHGGASKIANDLNSLFPGDDYDRLVWSSMLTAYGRALEEDAGKDIRKIVDSEGLKLHWRLCNARRLNMQGRGKKWPDEYKYLAGEIESRVDNAIKNPEEMTVKDCLAVKEVFINSAQEIAGEAWESKGEE